MQSLDEGVVQDEHEGSSPPCPSLTPEEHLTNVANILNFGMTQAEFPITSSDQIFEITFMTNIPENQRSVQNQTGNDNGQDQTRDQTQSGVRVWE